MPLVTAPLSPAARSVSIPGSPPAPVLSCEHLNQLAEARIAGKKIRRAVTVATIDGWLTAIFAGLTTLGGLFSPAGLLIGLPMAAIAIFAFRGARGLRRLEPAAGRQLGFNQIAFATLLTAYAAWSLYQLNVNPQRYSSLVGSDPQLREMLGSIDDLTRLVGYAVYGTLIAVAVFVQGGTALYYFTRQRYVREYIARTPQWILDMQRAGFQL